MKLLLVINKFVFSNSKSLKDIYLQKIIQTDKSKDLMQLEILRSFQRLNDQILLSHQKWTRANKKKQQETFQMQKNNQRQKKRQSFFYSYPNLSPKVKSIRNGQFLKGIYVYGSPGSGKTFISQLFYENLNIKEKSKYHFHEFMANVQKDLFQLQQQKLSYDPLTTIANRRAKQTRLLFLDEFQVTDIADAIILKRLFQKLIENEMILVATSNRQPDQLYKNGHQRQYFIPFITFLKENCQILNAESQIDYRYAMELESEDQLKTYLNPINNITDEKLNKIFTVLAKIPKLQYEKELIEVIEGRKITVPRTKNKICIYYFEELCDNIMSDSDFRAICRNHKAIIVKNIPIIYTQNRNIVNRFIKLIDEVYVNNVQFYCNAEVNLQQLIIQKQYQAMATQQQFAMNRCKSRLAQFQTKKYKQRISYYEEYKK